eukprot:358280-Chlamydomonas_euryale.AAC.3
MAGRQMLQQWRGGGRNEAHPNLRSVFAAVDLIGWGGGSFAHMLRCMQCAWGAGTPPAWGGVGCCCIALGADVLCA